MTIADLDRVMAVEVMAYSFPWSRGNFVDSLAAGYWMQTLTGDDGALLGYLVAMPGVDELHLLNLTVAPAAQGQGLSHLLMQALLAHARAQGLPTLWLEVRHGNERAQALYRRWGFVQTGLRRGYYPAAAGRREDAVVMRRVVDPGFDPEVEPAAGGGDGAGRAAEGGHGLG